MGRLHRDGGQVEALVDLVPTCGGIGRCEAGKDSSLTVLCIPTVTMMRPAKEEKKWVIWTVI